MAESQKVYNDDVDNNDNNGDNDDNDNNNNDDNVDNNDDVDDDSWVKTLKTTASINLALQIIQSRVTFIRAQTGGNDE